MVPVRTCIGSRRRAPRSSLLRVVIHDDRVVADPKAVMPGRGAWLTPTVEAYELAVSRKAFRRALRLDREPDTSAVLEYLTGSLPGGHEGADKTEQAERLMDN